MKFFILALALVVVSVGCSQERSAASAATTVAEAPPAIATVSTAVPQEPELTPEQIAHNDKIGVAVRVVQLAHDGGANKDLPNWVADQYAAYQGQDYPRERVAFSRSVGWGTGTYKGRQFNWFAYTNTDAWLQFNLSVAMAADDLGKIIGGRKDGYGRFREAELPNGNENYLPGTATWIGDTNYWLESNCTVPRYDKCDIGAALDKSVADLNGDLPGLELTVQGRFPW